MQKVFLSLALLILSSAMQAQKDSVMAAPYKRFPTVPPLRLLKTDSLSFFTKADLKKNRPVLIMLFNPECEHCRRETEEIIKRIDDFKKIQIVMATMMPMDMLRGFAEKYGLQRFDNIITGKDIDNILQAFYNISTLPLLAFYDKKGGLIGTFEGSLPVEEVLAKFDQK